MRASSERSRFCGEFSRSRLSRPRPGEVECRRRFPCGERDRLLRGRSSRRPPSRPLPSRPRFFAGEDGDRLRRRPTWSPRSSGGVERRLWRLAPSASSMMRVTPLQTANAPSSRLACAEDLLTFGQMSTFVCFKVDVNLTIVHKQRLLKDFWPIFWPLRCPHFLPKRCALS